MGPGPIRCSGWRVAVIAVAMASCDGRNPAFTGVGVAGDAAVDGAAAPDLPPPGSGGAGGAGGAGGGGKGGSGGDEHDPPPGGAGGASGEPLDGGQDAADQPPVVTDAAEDPAVAIDQVADVAPDGPAADAPVPLTGCLAPVPAGWICVSAGSFTMGSPSNEPQRSSDENQHLVTITRPFWMKVTEVTQGEWQALMGNNPAVDKCGPDCPVENVNWYQAIALANAWSVRDGYPPCYLRSGGATYDAAAAGREETPTWPAGPACRGYRLATEAEWEYAARAGTSTAFHGGAITQGEDCNDLEPALDRIAWYCGNSNGDLRPVATKQPNAWGLHDMHGSVWEWLWDPATSGDPEPSGPAIDPLGPTSGGRRRDRGGSYQDDPATCRISNRDSMTPGTNIDDTGVRLVRTAL